MERIIIDVHTHFYPKSCIEALNKRGIIKIEGEKVRIEWGKRRSLPDIRVVDIERKRQDLKKIFNAFNANVYSLLSISVPWTYLLPKEEEVIVAKQVNDEIARIVNKYPQEFGGLATLPLNDVEASIEEAERAVKDLGLHGFIIGTGIGNKTIADEEYRPLLKKISQLGKPILIHPGTLPLDVVLNDKLEAIFTSWMFETTFVVTKLASRGILRDYNLTLIASHGGGFIPYQLGRFDLAPIEPELATIWKGGNKPSDDLKKFVYYDSIVYTKEALEFLVKVMGEDHVVFGTDHPFRTSRPELSLRLVEEVARDDEVKEKIYYKNARNIFKIDI